MKISILAFASVARNFVLRSLYSMARGWCSSLGAAVWAQEKPVESSHNAGWVVIPVEEYRVLRAKAYPVEHDPEPPPTGRHFDSC